MTDTSSLGNADTITLIGDDIYAKLKIVSAIKTSLTKPKHQYVIIAFDELFERASTITPEEATRFQAKEYYQIIIRPKTLLQKGVEYSCFEVISLITWQQKAKLDHWEEKLQKSTKPLENHEVKIGDKGRSIPNKKQLSFKKANPNLKPIDDGSAIL